MPSGMSSKYSKQERHTYIYGIEKDVGTESQSSLIRKNRELEQDVVQLKQRVAQSEQESKFTKMLDDQIQSLLTPNMIAHHGPDTIQHMHDFSLDSMLDEFHF